MEIIENRALLVKTRNPYKITETIPGASILNTNEKGIAEVLVDWDLGNAMVLQNLGFKKVPSPILSPEQYKWPGVYTPFEHQKATAAFITLNRRAFCLSEMGVGKTVSVAWAADYLMRLGAIKRVLIIAPLSILDCAWRGDLFKTVMHRRVAIAHGTRSARVKAINSGAEFVIINYDGVPSVYEELFCANFDMVVCDESTNLKNANIRRWKKINALIRPNTWVLLMTGSPISQSPLDAYGQARLVNPSSVPSYYESFKSDLMLRVGPYKWVPKPDATERVYALLQPAIRYTKEECFDLPEQLYTTQELSMTPQQEKYYEALRKELLFETSGVEVSAVNAAVLMNKLLQVAAGSVYADYDVDQTHRAVLDFDCSEKFNAMLEIIEQTTHKTLIFATYQHTIERIQEFLNTKGVTNDVIYGKVAPRKRQAIIQDFQTTDKVKVLILHPRTASHGITLTAANTIIWFSPTTSAEAYIQANARVHRAGQRNPSLVVHLCNSPVEKQLYRALSERTTTQAELLEMYKNVLKISA